MSLRYDLELLKQALDDYLQELCDIYGRALVDHEDEVIDYCNERISTLHPLSNRLTFYIDLLSLEEK